MPTARDVLERKADWSVDCGDSTDWVWKLRANSVHAAITSPPYYSLRKYLPDGHPDADREIGTEQSPSEYVDNLVEVFRGVRRALHPSGVLWLNLGFSYAQSGMGGNPAESEHRKQATNVGSLIEGRKPPRGWKPKDLIQPPFFVSEALREDSWYLRGSCPWVSRNKMPESADDRPGSACEMVFLLSKEPDYFFDMTAVRRASKDPEDDSRRMRDSWKKGKQHRENSISAFYAQGDAPRESDGNRNFRNSDLWFDSVGMLLAGHLDGTEDDTLLGFDVNTQPDKKNHFAQMPRKLIRPMILAGTSEHGCCPHCSAPWIRVTEKERVATRPGNETKLSAVQLKLDRTQGNRNGLGGSTLQSVVGNRDPERHVTATRTVGWEPSCKCAGNEPVPCVVMDPFVGAGNVLAVARELRRRAIGADLNEEYVKLARKRIGNVIPNLI